MRIIAIIVGLTLIFSCDCYQVVTGTVIDIETGQPISDLTVINKNKEWDSIATNDEGNFELSSVSGGINCPPMTVILKKNDYKKIEIDIPVGEHRIIKLEKNKKDISEKGNCIPEPDTLDKQEVLIVANKNAEFPGGQSAMLHFIMEKLRYPKEQEEWQSSIYATFVIDSLGKIRNECISKRYSESSLTPIEKEVLRVIKEMPDWTPAESDGKKVYMRINIPINIDPND